MWPRFIRPIEAHCRPPLKHRGLVTGRDDRLLLVKARARRYRRGRDQKRQCLTAPEHVQFSYRGLEGMIVSPEVGSKRGMMPNE